MLSDQQAAELALLVVYAMDQFQADRMNLAPAPDPRLGDAWRVLGYLTAVEGLLHTGDTLAFGKDVCYGYLAQSVANPAVFVAPIRGTALAVEWVKDAEFLSMPHPVVGRVEAGFWSIYESLTYRPVAGKAARAAQGLAAAVGQGELIVLGHSLGAPLATYLSFDLAAPDFLDKRVQAVLFASPRPGNSEFVKAYDARVIDYQLWNFELDIVPRVPRGQDYADLPKVNWIGLQNSQAHIRFDFGCFHHLLCYCAQLNYSMTDWHAVMPCDLANTACILAPTGHQ